MENAIVEIQGLSIAESKCSFCLKSDIKLFECSRCRCAKYCSKACQKKHWSLHKANCEDYESASSKVERYKLKSTNYSNEGNYRKSGEYLTYIYDYYKKELGENDDVTCEALHDLALNYHKQKLYVDADLLFRSVFTPLGKTIENKGPDFKYPSYVRPLMNNYAANLIAMEKYEDAVTIFKQTLSILPKEGCDTETISCTANLAVALMNSNKLAEADEILVSLLKKSKEIHGESHTSTLYCLNNIGTLYLKYKRYSEAETVFKECFEIQKKTLGINHPFTLSTLNNLFHVFINQQKINDAATACLQCLEKRKLVLGYENRDTLFSMNNWGVVCIAKRDYAEAEKVFTECLVRMKKVLGDSDENTINTTIQLIRLYQRTGRNDEALKLKKTIPVSKLKDI